MDVPEHDRLSVALRQACDPRGQRIDLQLSDHVFFRPGAAVGLTPVELDEARSHAADSVADDIDRDPVQPCLLLEVADTLRRVGLQRLVGTQEGVLRDLLGVMPVPRQRQAHRVDAVLVVADQPLENALRTLHLPPSTQVRANWLQKYAEP